MYCIELDWKPPTGNRIRKLKHWQYAKLRESWVNRFKAYFILHKTPFPGNRKVYIIVDRPILRGKRLDKMNLVWMCKPAFDALQQIGVLIDDGDNLLEAEYIQSEREGGLRLYMTTDKEAFEEKISTIVAK